MFRKSLIRYLVTTREILIEQSLASSKVNKTGKILTRPITFIILPFSPDLLSIPRPEDRGGGLDSGKLRGSFREMVGAARLSVRSNTPTDPSCVSQFANLEYSSTSDGYLSTRGPISKTRPSSNERKGGASLRSEATDPSLLENKIS